jgi:hypothetical protein
MSILSEMSFWVPSSGAAYTDCDTGIAKKMPDGGIHTTIVLNITQFCDNMCDAAEKFYCSWPDKGDFDTHKIQIIYGEAPKP